MLQGHSEVSMSGWMKLPSGNSFVYPFGEEDQLDLIFFASTGQYNVNHNGSYTNGAGIPTNVWVNVIYIGNNTNQRVYIDGQLTVTRNIPYTANVDPQSLKTVVFGRGSSQCLLR